jgi:hypothetical protein
MKGSDLIRYAVVLATLAYLFGGDGGGPRPPKPEPVPCVVVEPYVGSMTGLHQTSRSMEEQDRIHLSDAFKAGGDMVNADGRGLIADTEKAQSFVVGILSFDYNGVFKPSAKYPALADSIEAELVKCIGDDIAPMSNADRSKFANCLTEIGKATR